MIEYLILGTSHEIQDTDCLGGQARGYIVRHDVKLVAEEFPLDIVSRVHAAATMLHVPYLQIDLLPHEWPDYGIDREMKARLDAGCLQGLDVRLSNADTIREDLWLRRIEGHIESGRVLIVCGYLHSDYLAARVHERGGKMLDKRIFPPELAGRKPEKVFNPTELHEHLRNNL